MAIPLLLTQWFDVYQPVYDEWRASGRPIHEVEKDLLSWNHCQAAAWIAGNWGLPDLMVCCVGLHSALPGEIRELELENTAVTAVGLSSLATPAFRNTGMAGNLVRQAKDAGLDLEKLIGITSEVEDQIQHLAVSLDINTVERPPLREIIAAAHEKMLQDGG
jgi:hypothetical protein